MTTANDVIAVARSLLGVPFHHQMRSRLGIDCAGVPIFIARELALVDSDFDVNGYAKMPDGKTLQAYCDRHMIVADEPEAGGAVLIAWRDGPPHHLGIVANHVGGGLSIIHADGERQKKVIETRLEFSNYFRLVRAYRFAGVTY